MSRKDRKSIAIIGEGEAEWFFIDSLRLSRCYPLRLVPSFPQHTDIGHIRKLILQYVCQGYDYIVCLVNMDRLSKKEAETRKYTKARTEFSSKRYAGRVMFLESNPCTELWFLLHFITDAPVRHYNDREQLIEELRHYMPGYEETEQYLSRIKIQQYLEKHGDLALAERNAEQLCRIAAQSEDGFMAYSEIYKLFNLLKEITPMDG